MKFLIRPIRKQFSADKELIENIHNIIGEDPDNLALYKLSFRRTRIPNPDHTTFQENNERLEFLGDTVLDLIIAEYLFRRYPTKDEGFLTASKSNLVNRELLGSLCKKMGLDSMIVHESLFDSGTQPKNIYGDTLEAFIAAIYLDKGYDFTRDFVLDRMFGQFTDIESLINLSKNFKSQLLEWKKMSARLNMCWSKNRERDIVRCLPFRYWLIKSRWEKDFFPIRNKQNRMPPNRRVKNWESANKNNQNSLKMFLA